VVNSTERCQAAARVRKVAAKFQALAVIPRLQALFLFVGVFPGTSLPEMKLQLKSGQRMGRSKRSALILLAMICKVPQGESLNC
jgi:hypothetical protein